MNKKWWVCINFTDLNKAYLKDNFSLSKINRLVDVISGHQTLSFIGQLLGYNQIRIVLEDEEKRSFITKKGLYCYKVMPFKLKNVGATY